MTALWFALVALIALLAPAPQLLAQAGRDSGAVRSQAPGAPSAQTRDSFHFTGVTLTDGDHVYANAEVHVWVKESGGGYTRADYVDENGRRLGFYEAFRVVARGEPELKAWAVRNFPDRTTSTR
ncbi:MAG TPA: hypothetical protein VIC59_08065 [Gemmatimonadota bacterium]|jgi:hypothetical protein